MTDVVEYNLDNRVATITIRNGKVNALSPAVFAALNTALDQAEQDNAVVVLTGQPGIFSAGYDLKEMQTSPEAATQLVRTGSSFCRRLLAFPTPVIAACSGHAIAKGSFILLSSDWRLGTEGPFKLGLNEVAIGMTMHHAGIEFARNRLTPACFQRAVINAEMFSPEAAVQAGFLDALVPADQLLSKAQEEAARMAETLNMKAHVETKLKARAAYLSALDAAIEKDARARMVF